MTENEYPYKVAETAAPANGAGAAERRFRFRSPKMKHMKEFRADAAGTIAGGMEMVALFLAGVDEEQFATPGEAQAYIDEMTLDDFELLARAFQQYRGVGDVPPTSGTG